MIPEEKSKNLKSLLKQDGIPITNTLETGLKKIIKKNNSNRADNGNSTTGRNKKVQFNTLPEFSRPKNKSIFSLSEGESTLPTDLKQCMNKSREIELIDELKNTSCKSGELKISITVTNTSQ